MTLRLYNTLTRSLEIFTPIDPGFVRMYVCGMTIYDLCHMGHARMMMAFDVIYRWLQASGYQVNYVRNITDIDDKIIKRAVERGISIRALTDEMVDAMRQDIGAIGVAAPTHEPRATEYVPQMLSLISTLERKGLAYRAEGGDVNFAVRKFPGYGKLSGKSIDELRAGERVAVPGGKGDPLDFVLWKATKPDEPSDASFDADYGPGRPGWHIDNEKMSKSLGNFFTIRDVLQRFDGETLRFFMLRTHYRSPFNFSDQLLDDARTGLRRLYTALDGIALAPVCGAIDWAQPQAAAFKAAMDEDFNTPGALAVLFELASECNRSRSVDSAELLRALAATLGLLQQAPRAFLQAGSVLDETTIAGLIADRAAAKLAKNFAEADRIRHELAAQGIELKDSALGTTWVRA